LQAAEGKSVAVLLPPRLSPFPATSQLTLRSFDAT
jgi:hypothetical protein